MLNRLQNYGSYCGFPSSLRQAARNLQDNIHKINKLGKCLLGTGLVLSFSQITIGVLTSALCVNDAPRCPIFDSNGILEESESPLSVQQVPSMCFGKVLLLGSLGLIQAACFITDVVLTCKNRNTPLGTERSSRTLQRRSCPSPCSFIMGNPAKCTLYVLSVISLSMGAGAMLEADDLACFQHRVLGLPNIALPCSKGYLGNDREVVQLLKLYDCHELKSIRLLPLGMVLGVVSILLRIGSLVSLRSDIKMLSENSSSNDEEMLLIISDELSEEECSYEEEVLLQQGSLLLFSSESSFSEGDEAE